jgi:hypothetical protein
MNERRLSFMLEVCRDPVITAGEQNSLLPFEIALTAGVLDKRQILESLTDVRFLLQFIM